MDNRGFLIRNYIRLNDVDETRKGITQTEYNKVAKNVNAINELDEFAFNKPRDNRLLDINWVRGRFNISNYELSDPALMYGRFFSTSSYKYSSTRLGGHIACNPKPQYTRYADIRQAYNPTVNRPPLTTGITQKNSNIGMGSYYSEVHDDNAQLVYLQFGFRRFNGLLDYLISAIDYGDVVVANTGRQPTYFRAGETVGTIIAFALFPITSVIVYGLKFAKNFLPISKAYDYYYMRPAMHVYWATVNQLALQFATELKLLNPKLEKKGPEDLGTHDLGVPTELDRQDFEDIASILGDDIFDGKTGFLDIYAVMAKPQALYRAYLKHKQEQMENGSNFIRTIDGGGGMVVPPNPNDPLQNPYIIQQDIEYAKSTFDNLDSFQKYLDKMVKQNTGVGAADSSPWAANINDNIKEDAFNVNKDKNASQGGVSDVEGYMSNNIDATDEESRTASSDGYAYDFHKISDAKDKNIDKFKAAFDSVVHDGGQNAIFQVEYTGSVGDQISNSTKEIDIGGTLKSVATASRDMKFNLAGGNLGFGLDLGQVAQSAKEVLMGGLSGVTLGLSNVLATIFGDAYVDLPKMWDDSSFDKATVSYTIKLRSPYNNVFSRFQNEIIPLCMLLAGILPLSTGQASYTSPFLCNVTCQGVQNIKLGMITSMSITRAVTNMPYNKAKQPMGIDVTFSVTDFSTLLTAPVTTGIFNQIFGFGMHEDSPIGRWIATACGRDIQTEVYFRDKLSLRMARTEASIKSYFSGYKAGADLGFSLNAPLGLFTAQGNLRNSLRPSSMR